MARNIRHNSDEQHLRLLTIFHYVLAALYGVAGCLPLIHLTLGIAILSGAFDQDPNPPPPAFGLMFTLIGGTIPIVLWSLAALALFTGRFLARRTHYRFCFVAACIECIQVPKGTILGVFTILVLSRPSVKALFDGVPARDPRLDAVDDSDRHDGPAPAADGSIKEGKPGANPPA